MYRLSPLKNRVETNLKVLGLRPVSPEEGADHLNRYGCPDPQGEPWTPKALAAYLEEHDIRPNEVPDLSHFQPVVPDREWNGRSILRAIERGPEEAEDRLRKAIMDDVEVRRAVVHLCSNVHDNPYQPGIYQEWLNFAVQQETD